MKKISALILALLLLCPASLLAMESLEEEEMASMRGMAGGITIDLNLTAKFDTLGFYDPDGIGDVGAGNPGWFIMQNVTDEFSFSQVVIDVFEFPISGIGNKTVVQFEPDDLLDWDLYNQYTWLSPTVISASSPAGAASRNMGSLAWKNIDIEDINFKIYTGRPTDPTSATLEMEFLIDSGTNYAYWRDGTGRPATAYTGAGYFGLEGISVSDGAGGAMKVLSTTLGTGTGGGDSWWHFESNPNSGIFIGVDRVTLRSGEAANDGGLTGGGTLFSLLLGDLSHNAFNMRFKPAFDTSTSSYGGFVMAGDWQFTDGYISLGDDDGFYSSPAMGGDFPQQAYVVGRGLKIDSTFSGWRFDVGAQASGRTWLITNDPAFDLEEFSFSSIVISNSRDGSTGPSLGSWEVHDLLGFFEFSFRFAPEAETNTAQGLHFYLHAHVKEGDVMSRDSDGFQDPAVNGGPATQAAYWGFRDIFIDGNGDGSYPNGTNMEIQIDVGNSGAAVNQSALLMRFPATQVQMGGTLTADNNASSATNSGEIFMFDMTLNTTGWTYATITPH